MTDRKDVEPRGLNRDEMAAITDRLKSEMIVPDASFNARALRILAGPTMRMALVMRVANLVYYAVIVAGLGWMASMALDNTIPVKVLSRTLLTPSVHAGDKLMIRSRRIRIRQCELTRRFSIVDGIGRRYDFEPEKFDAYGPVSSEPEEDTTLVSIPPEAVPGRGRYVAITAWDCNPLQRALGWSITVVQPAVEFEILSVRG